MMMDKEYTADAYSIGDWPSNMRVICCGPAIAGASSRKLFIGYPATASKGQKQHSALSIEAFLSQAGGLKLKGSS